MMAAQQTVLADDQCPAPALTVKESPITQRDEQNYSLAETQVIFADYVRKIAKRHLQRRCGPAHAPTQYA